MEESHVGVSPEPNLLTIGHSAETLAKSKVVPKAGLEPARLAAGDFESPASTIPPLGHVGRCSLQKRVGQVDFHPVSAQRCA